MTQPTLVEEFIDDSDEQSINTGLSTIKDQKEVDDKRKKRGRGALYMTSGPGLDFKLGAMQAASQQNEVTVSMAAAKGPPSDFFSLVDKPTFTRFKKDTPLG